jgi:hypothetical protein
MSAEVTTLSKESVVAIIEGLAAKLAPPSSAPSRMMTEREAAEFCGVRPQTLRQWRSDGRAGPPFTRVCGAIRYSRVSLQTWLDKRTQNPTTV